METKLTTTRASSTKAEETKGKEGGGRNQGNFQGQDQKQRKNRPRKETAERKAMKENEAGEEVRRARSESVIARAPLPEKFEDEDGKQDKERRPGYGRRK